MKLKDIDWCEVAGALVIVAVITGIGVAFVGCAWKKANTLKCKTTTEIKRTCEAHGEGREIRISPVVAPIDE